MAERMLEEALSYAVKASYTKMFATEMCGRVADRCLQMPDGACYICEYSIECFYRDVRLFCLYEEATQIQQIIIAREMIKQTTA